MISIRGRDQGGQLGIAELIKQAKDVAVDGLGPDRIAIVEVAAHAGRVDPRVECGGVERDTAPFAIAEDADTGLLVRAGLLREPVDQGQNLLHLVADDVPTQLKRRSVDELAAGQPGVAVAGGDGAVDQGRDNHPAAALGQPPRHLSTQRDPAETRPTSCSGNWSASGMTTTPAIPKPSPGSSSKPSPVTSPNAGQRMAKTLYVWHVASRSGRADRADELRTRERDSRVAHPQDVRQPLAVGLDRGIVGGGRMKVSLPVQWPPRRRLRGLPEQESIHPGDHRVGDISGHGERLGAGKGQRL